MEVSNTTRTSKDHGRVGVLEQTYDIILALSGNCCLGEGNRKEANPVFKASTEKHSKQVEKDRKRKATKEMKRKRKETKNGKSNDDTMQACRDYAQHNGTMMFVKTFLVNFLKT